MFASIAHHNSAVTGSVHSL